MFYSAPQLLTVLIDPITAVKLTALIFPTIGALATYHVMRRCFGVSWQASCPTLVLFQLNSFLLFRIVIGHLPYHVFGLMPVLCWLVLLPAVAEPQSFRRNISSNVGKVITGAIVLAIMVYAGATNFVIPAVLSVAAVLLVQHARSGWRLAQWCILAGACLWAIPLSAVKLVPAFIFIRSYPRPYIEGTLFVDPIRLFEVLTASLFAPEILPNGVSPVKGSPGFYGRHELEYSVYIVSLLLIVAALVSCILKPARPRHLFALMALVLVTGIPIALSFSFGNQTWGRILLHIPIINNNTTFVRWWSIYTFLLIVIAGLAFDRVCNERVRDIALGASVLIVVVQLASRNLVPYQRTHCRL